MSVELGTFKNKAGKEFPVCEFTLSGNLGKNGESPGKPGYKLRLGFKKVQAVLDNVDTCKRIISDHTLIAQATSPEVSEPTNAIS